MYSRVLLSSLISPPLSFSLFHPFPRSLLFLLFFSLLPPPLSLSLPLSPFFTGESLKVKRSHGLYPLPPSSTSSPSPGGGGVRRCRLILRSIPPRELKFINFTMVSPVFRLEIVSTTTKGLKLQAGEASSMPELNVKLQLTMKWPRPSPSLSLPLCLARNQL